jgi:hypothetical protein
MCLVVVCACSTNGDDPSATRRAPSGASASVESSPLPSVFDAAPSEPLSTSVRSAHPIVVKIKGESLGPVTVTIESDGVLDGARAATRAEINDAGAALFSRDIALVATSEVDYLLIWHGSPCDKSGTVTVSATSVVVAPSPRHACDAVGTGWGVVLSFAAPPEASSLTLQPTRLLPD